MMHIRDQEKWQKEAQELEFQWHATDGKGWGTTDKFEYYNGGLFRALGYTPDDFNNGIVLDVGAGSRLRSKFFRGAKIVVLDPLADRYLAELPWSDVRDAWEIYSEPAEDFCDKLEGRADLVMCLNMLDHCFDPVKVLSNFRRYARESGQVLLSTDLHAKADAMHPGHFDRHGLDEMAGKAGFSIERSYLGLQHKRAYGHGVAYSLVMRPGTAGDRCMFPTVRLRGIWIGPVKQFVKGIRSFLRQRIPSILHPDNK